MMIKHCIVKLKGETFEVSENEERSYFTEISDRKIKAHFTISKNKDDNKKGEYGLKVFCTEVFMGR